MTRKTVGTAMIVGMLMTAMGTLAPPASAATSEVLRWDTPNTTGYDWIVPEGVTSVTFELYGARGGASGSSVGGLGGKTVATISVTPGELLIVNVGLFPGNRSGNSGMGGGGSDVRRGPRCAGWCAGGTTTDTRILVAGGGGGAGAPRPASCAPDDPSFCSSAYAGGDGGPGGGLVWGTGRPGGGSGPVAGQPASGYGGCGGEGGSQTAGGRADNGRDAAGNCIWAGITWDQGSGTRMAGGKGGDAASINSAGGGGGGGYFGGGGGASGVGGGGGGGGSSYAAPDATNVSMLQGVHDGSALVVARYENPAPPPVVEPSAPLELRAGPGSAFGQLRLTWSPPATAGSSPIVGYRIYRGTRSGSHTFLRQIGVATSFVDTVRPFTKYFYRVAAVSTVTGAMSNEASGYAAPWIDQLPVTKGTSVALRQAGPRTTTSIRARSVVFKPAAPASGFSILYPFGPAS